MAVCPVVTTATCHSRPRVLSRRAARSEFQHLVNETSLRETQFVVLVNVKEGAAEEKMKEGEVKELLGFKQAPYVDPKIIEINAYSGMGFASALDYVCRGPQ